MVESLLRQAANTFPTEPAIHWFGVESRVYPDKFTYFELWRWAHAVAIEIRARHQVELDGFLDRDLGKVLVAVAMDEGPLLVLAIASCWLAKLAVVPIDPSEVTSRLHLTTPSRLF
jgi:acyl-CoA synthetase (AMP-forming)/AMP-acid ligase II